MVYFLLIISFVLQPRRIETTFVDNSVTNSYNLEGLKLVKGRSKAVYVVKDSVRHKVPNPKTLFYLENYLGSILFLTDDVINMIPLGSPFPSWEPKQKIDRRHSSKFVKSSLLISGSIVNPAIVYWRGKLIACYRSQSPNHSVTEMDAFKYTSDILACQRVDKNLIFLNKPYYLTLPFDSINKVNRFINGEDPRLSVTSDNRLYLTFNRINITEYSNRKIFICEIIEDVNDENIILASNLKLLDIDHEIGQEDQKNWTPFHYKQNILFSYSILPYHRILTISNMDLKKSNMAIKAETICLSKCVTNCTWNFGQPRGGSSPIKINKYYYLSFFHSSTRGHATKWWATTYFMGAYIFSSQPPFNIKAMSKEPIVVKDLYEGKWTSSHTDFVPFPTTAWLESNTINLICGRSDRDAWIIKLDLNELLLDLTPVDSMTIGLPITE